MKTKIKTIVVTGTPGTGKTTIAKKLAKRMGFKYVNGKSLIKKHNLASYFDKRMNCNVVDIKKLNKLFIEVIKSEIKLSGIIIDSHLSHYLPKKYVDVCLITKCDIKKLNARLKKRRYSAIKIRENLDCEIFDVCLTEATENKHDCIVFDTTNDIKIKSFNDLVKKL
jgi:adenylate kinase